MSTDQVKEKLQALFVSYTKNLPIKLAGIESLWRNLRNQWDQKKIQDFHREVHSLCGSAGTYGYAELGKSARQLEIYLKSLLNNSTISVEQQNDITNLLNRINEIFLQSMPEKFPNSKSQPIKDAANSIVYILDPDENFTRQIGKQIKKSGYNLCKIPDLSKLLSTIKIKTPTAIIVDIESIDENHCRLLHDVQKELSIPLFCTAKNGDILTRLKAIHMGSMAFFKKPIDPIYLAKTLDQSCGFAAIEPYRILIIDDSRTLAEYFALILQEAGMVTNFITNPILIIETIEEFQPDLLLMDVYMPVCTGLELAEVLRQQPQYTRIPIIFLSTEDDRFKQLSALSLGGDDFLTKPILPQHLIEAVKSRAKRAGILSSFMMRDSLTGLLNHTNILQRLNTEIARAQRQSESLSFVMIDVDHFKHVNDTYGHPVGDRVLKSLSNLLLTSFRKTDLIGRYGGEEFAIILPNTNKNKSLVLCNEIREKFAQICYKQNNVAFYVTFSAGISGFPSMQDEKSLIAHADQALYMAKHNGRNQIISFDTEPMETIY